MWHASRLTAYTYTQAIIAPFTKRRTKTTGGDDDDGDDVDAAIDALLTADTIVSLLDVVPVDEVLHFVSIQPPPEHSSQLTFDVNPPRSGVFKICFSVLRKRGSDYNATAIRQHNAPATAEAHAPHARRTPAA